MESLEMCLAGGLHELGLLEQFKLNTLIHHWRDVVGPIYAGHTRIIDIKPPKIVLSADNSQWMQEVKMNQNASSRPLMTITKVISSLKWASSCIGRAM